MRFRTTVKRNDQREKTMVVDGRRTGEAVAQTAVRVRRVDSIPSTVTMQDTLHLRACPGCM